MPSHYAHYRFGREVFLGLPPELKRPAQRFRRLFDVGLQGPDPFFYYNILLSTPVGRLGKKYHAMPGNEFFAMACRRYRQDPSEGALAYLYGLLGHYCLDSRCHPFINAAAAEGTVSHIALETDFDRFLLTLDGEESPQTFDGSRYLKLTKGECATVADFYPPATQADIRLAAGNMAGLVRWLASPPGLSRMALNAGVAITGDKFGAFVMHPQANPNCADLIAPLKTLYDQAVESYPTMAQQLTAHLHRNALLGEEFVPAFG